MGGVLAGLLLPLVPFAAITIAPPGTSDEGCPSPRQVSDALVARLPGGVIGSSQSSGPGTLRVTIFDPPGGGIRFQLTNADGETVLYRTLPPPPGRPADCTALSETVALIVDRYLHEVGYEAPPLPPPAPPAAAIARPPSPAGPAAAPPTTMWQLGASIEGRLGGTSADGGVAGLSVGVQFGRSRLPWGLRLGSGFALPVTRSFLFQTDGTHDQIWMRRVPLRLGVFATLPAGPGRVEPGLEGGADLVFVEVSAQRPNGGGTYAAPFCDAALAYSVPLARHVYLRALGRGGLTKPFTFLETNGGNPILTTPSAYLEFGVESGVSFP
jgi:hypothetical protein